MSASVWKNDWLRSKICAKCVPNLIYGKSFGSIMSNIYNAMLYMYNKYGFSPIADQSLLHKSLSPMFSKYERSQWPTDDRSAQYVHLQTTVHKDLYTIWKYTERSSIMNYSKFHVFFREVLMIHMPTFLQSIEIGLFNLKLLNLFLS